MIPASLHCPGSQRIIITYPRRHSDGFPVCVIGFPISSATSCRCNGPRTLVMAFLNIHHIYHINIAAAAHTHSNSYRRSFPGPWVGWTFFLLPPICSRRPINKRVKKRGRLNFHSSSRRLIRLQAERVAQGNSLIRSCKARRSWKLEIKRKNKQIKPNENKELDSLCSSRENTMPKWAGVCVFFLCAQTNEKKRVEITGT